ncbi:hypothetical protein ABMY36_21915 [Vibrio vulnificus]|uniref:hypothetical protein n=1 Tax=Vibrio vulnificus TaxID=672 RepID=UPI000CD32877|nr:hypothetical protein [Vibrio vulnificus]EHH0795950.1 hypothetical protein [Vibrio vulnificus]EIX4890275.1 hypothetical protein [Vibrio vulnificus]EIZ1412026.1 hypothetical protein [Vibrio vulnificus]EJA3296767.1 hypothetical protein [Vibrio vulnificus]
MAVSSMQLEPLRSRDEEEFELKVGEDMRVRSSYSVRKMQYLKGPQRSAFSEKSVTQWAKRAQEKLAHFKATGDAPESVFDFD